MSGPDALFDLPDPKAGGPVYQGVSAQFRAMFPRNDPDAQASKATLSGWIRLALAHARAIDADQRPSQGRAMTSAELRETLTFIREATSSGDGFDEFLEELRRNDGPTAPHPQV